MDPEDESTDRLRDLIRAGGSRATPMRIEVLRVLRGADRALSHADIEAELAGKLVDRVTLYRVLDWLVQRGLAHRIADTHRVFRFSAAGGAGLRHDAHAHFCCERCGRVFCLEDLALVPPAGLPAGFTPTHVDLSIRGECASCGKQHRGRRAR